MDKQARIAQLYKKDIIPLERMVFKYIDKQESQKDRVKILKTIQDLWDIHQDRDGIYKRKLIKLIVWLDLRAA